MISTTSDIATFLNALFDGEVVSDEALDEMTTLGPEGFGLGIFTYTSSDGTLMSGTAGFITGYTAGMVSTRSPTTPSSYSPTTSRCSARTSAADHRGVVARQRSVGDHGRLARIMPGTEHHVRFS